MILPQITDSMVFPAPFRFSPFQPKHPRAPAIRLGKYGTYLFVLFTCQSVIRKTTLNRQISSKTSQNIVGNHRNHQHSSASSESIRRSASIAERPSHLLSMTPHAIFSPAFPAGCEVKSSGPPWITTVFPITFSARKRSVRTAR